MSKRDAGQGRFSLAVCGSTPCGSGRSQPAKRDSDHSGVTAMRYLFHMSLLPVRSCGKDKSGTEIPQRARYSTVDLTVAAHRQCSDCSSGNHLPTARPHPAGPAHRPDPAFRVKLGLIDSNTGTLSEQSAVSSPASRPVCSAIRPKCRARSPEPVAGSATRFSAFTVALLRPPDRRAATVWHAATPEHSTKAGRSHSGSCQLPSRSSPKLRKIVELLILGSSASELSPNFLRMISCPAAANPRARNRCPRTKRDTNTPFLAP